jgi:hypothetical protein
MKNNTPNQKPLRITNLIPAVVADGNLININNATGDTTLMFIQIIPGLDADPAVMANTIASIRMNINQLQDLSKSINDTIEKYKSQKSAK